jgi:hypothetical protein
VPAALAAAVEAAVAEAVAAREAAGGGAAGGGAAGGGGGGRGAAAAPRPTLAHCARLAADALCAASGHTRESLAAALRERPDAAAAAHEAAQQRFEATHRAILLGGPKAASTEGGSDRRRSKAARLEPAAPAAPPDLTSLSPLVCALGGPVYVPAAALASSSSSSAAPLGNTTALYAHYPAVALNNTTPEGKKEWLFNCSIVPYVRTGMAFKAGMGCSTGGGGSSSSSSGGGGSSSRGGSGGAAAAAAAAASSAPPSAAAAASSHGALSFASGTLFNNIIPVLPTGSIGSSGALSGAPVRKQYQGAITELTRMIGSRAASATITMGAKPARTLHDAAAAALAPVVAASAAPLRRRAAAAAAAPAAPPPLLLILRFSRIADLVGRLIGARLGFGSEVAIAGHELSQHSGAGAYLYVGGAGGPAAAAACIAHTSAAMHASPRYTRNFTRPDGTPMTAEEARVAWLDVNHKGTLLAAAGAGAVLGALEGREVGLEALRELLGAPVRWQSAAERGASGAPMVCAARAAKAAGGGVAGAAAAAAVMDQRDQTHDAVAARAAKAAGGGEAGAAASAASLATSHKHAKARGA